MKLELNTRLTITVEQGLTEAGIHAINSYIAITRPSSDADWQAINTPDHLVHYMRPLPDRWTWVYTVQHGEFRGNFAKRVSQYYKREFNLNCPTAWLAELGNLARRHTVATQTFEFEFVNRIDWEEGDFGDMGSCYWDSRSVAKSILVENGGLAICFFTGDEGFARAWVAEVSENYWIVFNGYGLSGDATLRIAQIMAVHVGGTYRKISLTNYGQAYGTVYINGGIGYAVGNELHFSDVTRHDLKWEDDYYECEYCGDRIHADDTYTDPHGSCCCEDCYYSRFQSCDMCGESFDPDDLNYRDELHYCANCLPDDPEETE